MQRTIRRLAVPLAGALLLAGCGSTNDSPETADAEQKTVASDGGAGAPMDDGGDDEAIDESEAWPEVDDESEEQGFYGPGEYLAMNMTGAGFIITLPAEGPEDIEAFREATGQEPVGYIKVEVDNTNGYEDAQPNGMTLVDTDGQEYEYESAFIVIDEWGPTMRDDGPEDVNDGYWYSMPDGTEISEAEYDELDGAGVDIYNAYLDTSASPTAKKTVWLMGPEVPEEMTYIELQEPAGSYQASPLE